MVRTRSLTAVTLVAVASIAVTAARAGSRTPQPGTYWDNPQVPGAGWAWGTLVDVRASSDTRAALGCVNDVDVVARTEDGHCYYTAPTGVSRVCYTSDPALLAQIRSVERNSYVVFQWGADGYCRSIFVSHDSSAGLGQSSTVAW